MLSHVVFVRAYSSSSSSKSGIDTTFLISIEECTKKIINKKDLMKDLLAKTGRRKI